MNAMALLRAAILNGNRGSDYTSLCLTLCCRVPLPPNNHSSGTFVMSSGQSTGRVGSAVHEAISWAPRRNLR